jgi:hypothetical protein
MAENAPGAHLDLLLNRNLLSQRSFFLVIGAGISGDAAGLCLAGGALGSQQIQT